MNPIYQSKPVRLPSCIGVLFTLFLAAFFWWVIFGKEAVNFWLGMSVATSTLAALSLILGGRDFRRSLLKFPGSTTFWMGLASAVALYVVFEVGYFCSRLLFSTSPEEVSNIYTIRSKANPFVISLVLLFITSPCEEIFWRGFLQRWAVGRFHAYAIGDGALIAKSPRAHILNWGARTLVSAFLQMFSLDGWRGAAFAARILGLLRGFATYQLARLKCRA